LERKKKMYKKRRFWAAMVFVAVLLLCHEATAITPTVRGIPNATWWGGETELRWAKAMEAAMDAVQGEEPSGALGTGLIFYVDSNVSNAGDGTNWDNAVATLDEAMDLCEDYRGDIVYVAQGHAEDWSAVDSADIDVIGVKVIGCGVGTDIPTFTYDNANAELVLGAANCYIYNLAFLPSVTGITHAIEVEADADGSVIDHCWFMDGETGADDEFTDAIQYTTASNNVAVVNCRFESYTAAGANTAIDLTAGVVEDAVVYGNYFNGNYAEAAVYSDDIDLRMLVAYNDVTNSASNTFGIAFTANATGICAYNVVNASTNYEIDEGAMITHGNNSDATDLGSANLDHLMKTAVANGDNMETEVVDGTVLSNILTKTGDTSDYARATMSIEYLAETVAAILTDTEAADSTSELRTLLLGSDTPGATATAQTAIYTVLANGTPATITTPGTNLTLLDIIGGNGTTTTAASATSVLGAIGTNEAAADTPFTSATVESDADGSVLEREEYIQAELAKVPKSDSTVSWNATALAAIEDEVDDSVETYELDHLVQAADADDPADDSIIAKLASKTADWSTFSASTDSQEAIRDYLETLQGVGFRGTCSSNAVTTTVICGELTGFGNDYFNTGWSLTVLLNASAPGTLNEGQTIDITDYDSLTGTFTLNVAAAEPVTASDEIYVRRTEELNLDTPTILGGSGNVWYVDSGTSGDGTGKTWENAFATITLALDGATESNGDVIYVGAGHSETLTAAYLVNDAGISIIGVGEGNLQPTMVLDHVDAQWDVSVADILIENIKFESSIANTKKGIDIADGGDGCHIKDCMFVDESGSVEMLIAIDVGDDADDVIIEGCQFITVANNADAGINVTAGTVDNLQIVGNFFKGDYDLAPIYSDQINTSCLIANNIVYQELSTGLAIQLSGAMTGVLAHNYLYSDSYTTMLDPGSMICVDNWGTDAIDQQAIRMPLSALTNDVAADRDGSALERLEFLCKYFETGTAGALVAPADTRSLLDILGSDGTTTTGALAGSILGAIGTNEAASATAFTSSSAEADADGSVLERLEYLQAQTEDAMVRLGIDTTTADVWYVDSVSASGGDGTSWTQSENTLKLAVDDATDSVGAYIFVAPGHAEATITASQAIDCPGITIVGLGREDLRPTFTMSGANGAMTHTVADVTWVNCIFISGTIDTTVCHSLDGSSDGATFIDCEWKGTTGGFGFVSSVTIGSTCDDVTFRRCRFDNASSGDTDATAAITNIAGVTDGMFIEDCQFYGAWTVAAISSANIDTDVVIEDSIIQNSSAGAYAVKFTAAALGTLAHNYMYTNAYATMLDPGSLKCFNNWGAIAADEAAMQIPISTDSSAVTATRDGSNMERLEAIATLLETGTLDKLTAPADTYSILDILGTDGATTTAAVAGSLLGAIGTNEAAADTPFTSATVEADEDGSVLERLESVQQAAASLPAYGGSNYLAVTVAFDGTTGAAHWGKAAETDEVLTVLGAVQLKILIECTETCTGTDGGTIALWGGTDVLIAATIINTEGADETNLDAGELWLDTSPVERVATASTAFFEFVAIEDDIGLDCQAQDIADGTIVFHVWWTALNATGAVAAGAGGTL